MTFDPTGLLAAAIVLGVAAIGTLAIVGWINFTVDKPAVVAIAPPLTIVATLVVAAFTVRFS